MARHWTIAVALLLGLTSSPASARTWTSASGTFKVDADLVEARPDGTLLLKRTDGKTIRVKLDVLSQADQDYVRETAGSLSRSARFSQVIDDPAATYVGAWTAFAGAGYNNNVRYITGGSGSNTATYQFTGLTPGQYQVSATWYSFTNRATNTPYIVSGGASPTTVRVNQQVAPKANSVVSGVNFQKLATVTITGSTITVQITDNASGLVIADAVQIARVLPRSTTGDTTTWTTTGRRSAPPNQTGTLVTIPRDKPTPTVARRPVPDAKMLAKKLSEVRDLLKDDFGKARTDATGRQALLDKLTQLANESLSNDPVSAFAVASLAAEAAADGGDLTEALANLTWLEERFQIADGRARKVELAGRVNVNSLSAATAAAVVPQLLSIMDEREDVPDYGGAMEIGRLAMRAARRASDPKLVSQVIACGKHLKEQKETYELVAAALVLLKTQPQDVEANLRAGKFLCLVRGKWEQGLPHLAASGDAELAPIAKRDLARPTSMAEQSDLANQWWSLSELPKYRSHAEELKRRSAYWYQVTLPQLTGLDKLRAEKRIEAATPEPAAPSAGATPKLSSAKIRTNSIGMKLAFILAGKFLMGTPASEGGNQDREGPQHKVRITRAFYMGIYPVTQSEYERVMGVNPSIVKGGNLPVDMVSWNDAVEFCRRLSAKENRTYRLPTEAEWEYACRAGTTTKYCFGNDESQLVDYAWYYANANGTSHPVGTKKPNAWGLYDMHGNVFERCQDEWRKYTNAEVVDPKGPEQYSSMAIRGACWDSSANDCRSGARVHGGDRVSPNRGNGFRVVCER